MNPWQALGWVALLSVLLLIGLLLYALGSLLGWSTYVAPAMTAIVIVLPLFTVGIHSLLRWSRKNSEQPQENIIKIGLEKSPVFFTDTDMGETLRRQWVGVLAEAQAVPLFLVLGSSQPDMRTLLVDALPLSRKSVLSADTSSFFDLYMTDNAAWLVVSPLVLGIAPPSAGATFSLQGQIPLEGLRKEALVWDIFLELLSSFPGPVAGAVITLLPKDLVKDEGINPEFVGRRMAALQDRVKRRVPLWLIMDRMDTMAGGKGFFRAFHPEGTGQHRTTENSGFLDVQEEKKTATASVLTKSLVPHVETQKPFGVVLESVPNPLQSAFHGTQKSTTAHGNHVREIGDCFDSLVHSLNTLSDQCDSALLQVSTFAGDVLLLRHSLQSRKMAFCSYGDALMRNNDLRVIAISLCGGTAPDGSRRIFARELFEAFIPSSAEKYLQAIPYKKNAQTRILAANIFSLVCAGLGMALAAGAWQAHDILGELESGVKLLQPSMQEQHVRDTLPSFNRLHAVTALVTEQEARCAGSARLFKTPQEAVHNVQQQLTHFIIPLLPTEYNKSEQLALWTESLLDWSRTGEPSLLVQTSGGETLARVDGGATAKGRKKVANLLAQWERLLPEDKRVSIRWVQSAYDAHVFAVWHAAVQKFLAAVEYCDSDVSVAPLDGGTAPTMLPPVRVRDLIGTEPLSFNFIATVSTELSFSRGNPRTPEWIAALHTVHDLRTLFRLRRNDSEHQDGTIRERWRNIAAVLPGMTELLAPQRFELALQNASAWGRYESDLQALMPQAASRQGLIALAAGRYSGEEAPPLVEAEESYKRLLHGLTDFAPIFVSERALLARRLVESPLKTVQAQGDFLAARMLQDKWTMDVVAPLHNVAAGDMEDILFGENGSAKLFADTVANPYLQITPKGYAPASVSGELFPFTAEFIHFINGDGFEPVTHSKRFPLELHILPVTANNDATHYPRGVTVRLQCGEKKIVGGAFNNKQSVSFVWEPDTCDSLFVQVHFDDFSVIKEYPDHSDVVDFIYDAVNGGMTFTPNDFPDSKGRLKAIGITRIKPRFELKGGEAVITMLEDPGIPVPTQIIRERQ